MGRYLLHWEIDESKIPVDAQERKTGWLMMLEMTKQDMQAGLVKEWGVFVSQTKGFTISEGTEEQMHAIALKYVPFVRFNIYPLLSRDQVVRIIESI
jgi:hypothetical protein